MTNDTIHKIDPNDESTWPPIAGKNYLVKAKDADYWIWYYHANHNPEDIKNYTHWREMPPLPEESPDE